jgi:hypothetical protein
MRGILHLGSKRRAAEPHLPLGVVGPTTNAPGPYRPFAKADCRNAAFPEAAIR